MNRAAHEAAASLSDMSQSDGHNGQFDHGGAHAQDAEQLEDSRRDKPERDDTEDRANKGRGFFLVHDVQKAQFANVLARCEPGSRRSGGIRLWGDDTPLNTERVLSSEADCGLICVTIQEVALSLARNFALASFNLLISDLSFRELSSLSRSHHATMRDVPS